MPKRKDHLTADVQFVLDECTRLAELIHSNRHRFSLDDFDYSLPSPSMQGGFLVCGRAAHDRLIKLAELARKHQKLENRAEIGTVLRPLKRLFVEAFIRDAKPITIPTIERVLSAAGRAASAECKTLTHLIPCHLMWEQEPHHLKVGPVTFHNNQSFRDLIAGKARRYALTHDESLRSVRRMLLRNALRYFDAFKWVAEVTIDDCAPKVSEALAGRAVTSALDCLHLLFGAENSGKMRVGGPRIDRDNRARLHIDSNGILIVENSSAGMGEVAFPKGWSAGLGNPDKRRHLDISAVALQAIVDPDLKRPLSNRFIDAAQWYGEAVREPWGGTKVVKYVTAIERMVMTEEHDDITGTVAERVAALCLDEPRWSRLERWEADCRRAYSIRSKLVHGSMSPNDPAVGEGIALASRLARATLIIALDMLGADALQDTNGSSKWLAKWYNCLVAHERRILAEVDTAGAPPGRRRTCSERFLRRVAVWRERIIRWCRTS